MKMRKKISWLLSFFMVFSLFMGSAGMIVKADGQKAVVRIARQDSTATFFLLTCAIASKHDQYFERYMPLSLIHI